MEIKILDTVKTERLGNRLWVTLAPFAFIVDGARRVIPAGFVFDGNSSPRPMWSICSPVGGPYGEAGLVHDYLYSLDCVFDISRIDADKIHRAIGRLRGAGRARAQSVYAGLRLGGAGSYRKIHSVKKLTTTECYDIEYARDRVAELRRA